MKKFKEWIIDNDLKIATSTFVLILIAILVFVNFYNRKYYNAKIDLLTKEKTDLEIALNERDNEIYALNLELASTEKTLADTAFELDLLAKKDIEDLHLEYVGLYQCTSYCCEKYPHICGTGSGKTASGVPITPDVTVAVNDTFKFPMGSIIYIENVGIRIVQDTGPFKGNKIDCAVDTHEHALNWEGQGKHKVWLVTLPKGE